MKMQKKSFISSRNASFLASNSFSPHHNGSLQESGIFLLAS